MNIICTLVIFTELGDGWAISKIKQDGHFYSDFKKFQKFTANKNPLFENDFKIANDHRISDVIENLPRKTVDDLVRP